MKRFFESEYRVSYADTDQMGVVYYANYLELFERSRTEMLRAVGFPYSEMEKKGLILPVKEAYCEYLNPAHYDDLLTLRSTFEEMKGVRIRIATEIRRGDELLVRGFVTLVSVSPERKVIRIPEFFKEACKPYLEEI